MALKKTTTRKSSPNKRKPQTTKSTQRVKVLRNKDLPVSQGQISEFRSEMNYQFTSVGKEFKAVRNETKSGFKKVDERFSGLEARFAKIDERFDRMEARFAKIDERFDCMEARFAEIDARFDRMEARFAEIDARFDRLESKIDSLTATVHRVLMIVEEQNARNKYVLDGFANLVHQVEANKKECDERINNLEQIINISKDSEL